MEKVLRNLEDIVKQLFPAFESYQIIQKQVSKNGTPFLISKGKDQFWVKLVNSSQMEDVLKDVEKQALQDIKSPNVTQLLEVKTKIIQGQRYDGLLFKFVEGEDLAAIFSKRKSSKQAFTEEEAKKLLLDVARGIQAISAKGWVHQDIKQKNIRYDKASNQYVILDLGLAYYSKNFQLTTGKHNRDYASPEQVYASVDQDKIPLITFSSDIAQLGQLVYELVTLKNPFKDNEQGKLNFQRITKGEYRPLKELNPKISNNFISLIDTMLNPHPGYRFRSPEDLICTIEGRKYIRSSDFEKGVYFQVWKGPHGYLKNIDQFNDEVQGVVVSASQMPGEDAIEKVKEKGIKLIFDPETHLLTENIHNSWHSSFSKWDWYDYPLKPASFKLKSRISTFVAQIVQSQIDLGVDYIMPPYFNISNPESEWRNLNGVFYHECLQYCKRISLNKPVICPISVSQSVIGVDRSRKDLVDFYSQLPDLNVFFLRIDAKDHNSSIPTIQLTSKLIEELEHHHPVLLADAGTVVFGYFAKGLSACITSLVDSKRVLDLAAMQTEKKTGGSEHKPKFFIPRLFQFVKVDGELPALIKELGATVLCDCAVCKKAKKDKGSLKAQNPDLFTKQWGKTDTGNHFFCCVSEWSKKLENITPDEKIKLYKAGIDEGRKIFSEARSNLVFTQIVKRDDCANWESAFFSK